MTLQIRSQIAYLKPTCNIRNILMLLFTLDEIDYFVLQLLLQPDA